MKSKPWLENKNLMLDSSRFYDVITTTDDITFVFLYKLKYSELMEVKNKTHIRISIYEE